MLPTYFYFILVIDGMYCVPNISPLLLWKKQKNITVMIEL